MPGYVFSDDTLIQIAGSTRSLQSTVATGFMQDTHCPTKQFMEPVPNSTNSNYCLAAAMPEQRTSALTKARSHKGLSAAR
jgi:hypothetical protein